MNRAVTRAFCGDPLPGRTPWAPEFGNEARPRWIVPRLPAMRGEVSITTDLNGRLPCSPQEAATDPKPRRSRDPE